eukprot:3152862-Ditylum_brightwellii.AAC.1
MERLMQDVSQRCDSVGSRERLSVVSHEESSWKQNVGLETAKDTLDSTTLVGGRTVVQPLAQRMRGKFTQVVPMGSYKDARDLLKQVIDDFGVPECMVTDGATEFVGKNTDF